MRAFGARLASGALCRHAPPIAEEVAALSAAAYRLRTAGRNGRSGAAQYERVKAQAHQIPNGARRRHAMRRREGPARINGAAALPQERGAASVRRRAIVAAAAPERAPESTVPRGPRARPATARKGSRCARVPPVSRGAAVQPHT